jgi:hypothetical protein
MLACPIIPYFRVALNGCSFLIFGFLGVFKKGLFFANLKIGFFSKIMIFESLKFLAQK